MMAASFASGAMPLDDGAPACGRRSRDGMELLQAMASLPECPSSSDENDIESVVSVSSNENNDGMELCDEGRKFVAPPYPEDSSSVDLSEEEKLVTMATSASTRTARPKSKARRKHGSTAMAAKEKFFIRTAVEHGRKIFQIRNRETTRAVVQVQGLRRWGDEDTMKRAAEIILHAARQSELVGDALKHELTNMKNLDEFLQMVQG